MSKQRVGKADDKGKDERSEYRRKWKWWRRVEESRRVRVVCTSRQ